MICIRWNYFWRVCNYKYRRSNMICYNTHLLTIIIITFIRYLFKNIYVRHEYTWCIVVIFSFKYSSCSFYSHSSIYILLRKFSKRTIFMLFILHKYIIPNFDPSFIFRIKFFWNRIFWSKVKYFSIRSTWPCFSCYPEVIFYSSSYSLFRNTLLNP